MEPRVRAMQQPYLAVCPAAPDLQLWLRQPRAETLPPLSPAGPPFAAWLRSYSMGEDMLHAVEGGRTRDGRPLYVGRAEYEGGTLPARVEQSDTAYVGVAGRERAVYQYEVLVLPRGRSEWIECSDGDVPAHAFPVCPMPNGETAYVGRVQYDGAIIPGRVIESQSGCIITHKNKERLFRNYDVLVILGT